MSVDGSAVDTCVRVHKSIYLSIYLSTLAPVRSRTPYGTAAPQRPRAKVSFRVGFGS